ncbi:hypothetical protein AZH11_22555 [Pseudomonas simiae]|nr:hypothetical protein AZH11_22555 [Pseudomonas simiae]
MPTYTPLGSNISCNPIFFINDEVEACLSTELAESADLQHGASAAHLFLQDGCDALKALGWKVGKATEPIV